MLKLRRTFEMPSIGARFESVDFAHSEFRVRVERMKGIGVDESMLFPTLPWTGYGDRPRIDVVLLGETRDTENGVSRDLARGDFAVGRALDSLYSRTTSNELLSLSIEWNLGSLGTNAPMGLPTGKLGVRAIESLTRFASGLLNAPDSEGQPLGALASMLTELRAEGVPFDAWRARDIVVDVPSLHQRVATVLGDLLSKIGRNPSTSSLQSALGLSRRRVGELVSELATRYGINGRDWRTTRDRWRLFVAAAAMSNRAATTESVAEAVGYGSPVAFCHAFRAAGLPSPGQVRAELARRA